MLTVYLDSSDYSLLSTASSDDRYRKIKEELLRYKANGQVDFVFSFLLISEALPTESSKNLSPGYQRVRAIGEMCGTSSLKSFYDSLEEEVGLYCQGRSFNPQGEWFPDLSQYAIDFADTLLNGLKVLPREKRRKITRNYKDYAKKMAGEKGLTEDMALMLGLVLIGRDPYGNAEKFLRKSFLDVAFLADFLESKSDLSRQASQVLRNGSMRMASRFNEIIGNLILETEKLVFDKSDYLKKAWQGQLEIGLCRFVERLSKEELLDSLNRFEVIKTGCPGVFLFYCLIAEYMRERWSGEKSKSLDSNQIADTAHAFYAPYVDIFRADKKTADIIKKVAPHINVVSKLENLPNAIESLLDASHE